MVSTAIVYSEPYIVIENQDWRGLRSLWVRQKVISGAGAETEFYFPDVTRVGTICGFLAGKAFRVTQVTITGSSLAVPLKVSFAYYATNRGLGMVYPTAIVSSGDIVSIEVAGTIHTLPRSIPTYFMHANITAMTLADSLYVDMEIEVVN